VDLKRKAPTSVFLFLTRAPSREEARALKLLRLPLDGEMRYPKFGWKRETSAVFVFESGRLTHRALRNEALAREEILAYAGRTIGQADQN